MRQRNKKNAMIKKIAVMFAAVVLVVAATIGGTLAWLTATSDTVTNTFTVGDINIKLDEEDVDNSTADADRDTANAYKIIPGGTSEKDPTVTVHKGSEKCYVYVTVENQLVLETTVVGSLDISSDWERIATSGNKTLYRYKEIVDASSSAVELPEVFTTVKYSESITKEDIKDLTGKKIIVNAYAHQSEYTNQATADAEAKTWAGIN